MVIMHFLILSVYDYQSPKPQSLCCLETNSCLRTRRHLLSTFNKFLFCLHCILTSTCCQISAVVVCVRGDAPLDQAPSQSDSPVITMTLYFLFLNPTLQSQQWPSLYFLFHLRPKLTAFWVNRWRLYIQLLLYDTIHLSNDSFEKKTLNLASLLETLLWNMPYEYSF